MKNRWNALNRPEISYDASSQLDDVTVSYFACVSSAGPQYTWNCYAEIPEEGLYHIETNYKVNCFKDDDGVIHPKTCQVYYTRA